MAYTPILESWQLPHPGPLSENLRFDMKMTILKLVDITALACDVAAFANTSGGVILIGANEHPKDSGNLSAYVPMSHADAHAVGDKLGEAIRLCSPKPVAEAKPIELDSVAGQYAVAINCEPYAAPPIGVTFSGHSGGEKWWAFPSRRGRENRNLRPEELATIMEPRLRRILLLLDRLPRFDPGSTRRVCFHSKHGSGDPPTYDIVSVDSETSSMRIRHTQFSHEVVIPLDAIRMIWRDTVRGMFHVSIDGTLMPIDTGIEFRH
ncbi:MAG: RNA-binding domain-containing protein [Kofleriaceae bacterium]